MKKFIATILSVLYLIASSGATFSSHYCMGKYIGWDVSAPAKNKCSNCGMTKENRTGCCNDKHQTLQLQKDQLATNVIAVPGNTIIYLNTHYPSLTQSFFTAGIKGVQTAHSPPGFIPIFFMILYCVFRI
ncbi:MAG: hypothetical protein M3R72_10045 [Bacteroidota bacterium]|nr:hypothetical protein [Bacteroidota bacterium]